MSWVDWIGPALEGVGAAGSAWSSWMAGDAASRNAEAQAALYQQNAGWSRYEADAMRRIGYQNWQNANTEASRIQNISEANARMIERLSLMKARGTTLIAGFNADSALLDSEFDALAVTRAAHRRALDISRESNRVQGAQVASYSKAGVEMSGSPMVVLNESIRLAEEDAAQVIEGGRLEAETLRSRGQIGAAITRGSAELQAGILSMQGKNEAAIAREQGALEADRLRWNGEMALQQAELGAKRSEAMAGMYNTQAGGMMDAAGNASMAGGIGSALTVAQGAAKLLGNKTVSSWLGLGGSSAAGGAGAASGASSYLGGMWGGEAAGAAAGGAAAGGTAAGGTAATGTMAGIGGIMWPAAIIAAMGIASQFLAKATDSSHTPQTAREYIAADLDYISRYSGILAQGTDTMYPYVGSDYSPVNAALWEIRQIYDRAGYTESQVLGMLQGAGWTDGLPTQRPRMHWEYDEGTYG
jgi:hypothetical protein